MGTPPPRPPAPSPHTLPPRRPRKPTTPLRNRKQAPPPPSLSSFDPHHQQFYFGRVSSNVTHHLKQTIPTHSFHPSLQSSAPPSFHRKCSSITDLMENDGRPACKRPISAPVDYHGRKASNVTEYLRYIPPAHLGRDAAKKNLPYFGRLATFVTDPSKYSEETVGCSIISHGLGEQEPGTASFAVAPQHVTAEVLSQALSARRETCHPPATDGVSSLLKGYTADLASPRQISSLASSSPPAAYQQHAVVFQPKRAQLQESMGTCQPEDVHRVSNLPSTLMLVQEATDPNTEVSSPRKNLKIPVSSTSDSSSSLKSISSARTPRATAENNILPSPRAGLECSTETTCEVTPRKTQKVPTPSSARGERLDRPCSAPSKISNSKHKAQQCPTPHSELRASFGSTTDSISTPTSARSCFGFSPRPGFKSAKNTSKASSLKNTDSGIPRKNSCEANKPAAEATVALHQRRTESNIMQKTKADKSPENEATNLDESKEGPCDGCTTEVGGTGAIGKLHSNAKVSNTEGSMAEDEASTAMARLSSEKIDFITKWAGQTNLWLRDYKERQQKTASWPKAINNVMNHARRSTSVTRFQIW